MNTSTIPANISQFQDHTTFTTILDRYKLEMKTEITHTHCENQQGVETADQEQLRVDPPTPPPSSPTQSKILPYHRRGIRYILHIIYFNELLVG